MSLQNKMITITLALAFHSIATPQSTTNIKGKITIENLSQCSISLANGEKSQSHQTGSGLSYDIQNEDEKPVIINLSFNGLNTKNQYHIPLFFNCKHTSSSGSVVVTGTNKRMDIAIDQKKETLNSAQMLILNENFIDETNNEVNILLYQPEWKAFKTS